MKKRNPWLMMLIVVLVLAVLACTCTSGLPSGNSGDTGNTGDSGNSGDSGDSGDSSGSASEVRGFPVVSDAYEVVDADLAGTISIVYKTKLSFDEVVSFYKDEIPGMGYSLDQDVTAAGNAVLTFSGPSNLSVTVSADPLDSSAQYVTISSLP
ncbi:MAG: hypothetical protein IPL78_27100 [Chloroflexi bacterium]|nr:hypothetical protein [Chloroflexota bacterium]